VCAPSSDGRTRRSAPTCGNDGLDRTNNWIDATNCEGTVIVSVNVAVKSTNTNTNTNSSETIERHPSAVAQGSRHMGLFQQSARDSTDCRSLLELLI
jgi:hypothetical protein